jgi:mannitol/fructose-specific phosphotransferase system IIA component (Ntr-type)
MHSQIFQRCNNCTNESGVVDFVQKEDVDDLCNSFMLNVYRIFAQIPARTLLKVRTLCRTTAPFMLFAPKRASEPVLKLPNPHVKDQPLQPFQTLADFTSPGLMVPSLQSETASEVVARLCAILHQKGGLTDSETFFERVMTRESMSPTCMSPGIALPHARLAALPKLTFTLARSRHPLTWFNERNAFVQIIFLFAVPEGEARTYLNVISAVARLSQNPALVGQLMRAPKSEGMFEVLRNAPLRRPRNPSVRNFGVAALQARNRAN